LAIKHSTTATKADEAGAEVNKTEWNADHTIENGTITNAQLAGSINSSKLLTRPPWTYLIEKDGANYVAWKNDGTQVSSNTDFDTVFSAVITDKSTNPAVIELSEGTFQLDSSLTFTTSDIVVRGQGKGVTTISATSSMPEADEPIDIGSNLGVTTDVHIHAIGDVTIRDNVVTLSTGANEDQFTVGDYVLIRDDTIIDPSGSTRRTGEIHKITAITSDDSGVLTIDSWAYKAYANASNAKARIIDQMQENITFQDMTFTDERADLTTSSPQAFLNIKYYDNINIINCEFNEVYRAGFFFVTSLATHVNGCTFRKILTSTAEASLHYGGILAGCHGATISNCNFYDVRHSINLVGTTRDDALGKDGGEGRAILQTNCDIKDCSNGGLDTHEGQIGVAFTNNHIIGNSQSSSSDNGSVIFLRSPCIITGNYFEGIEDGIKIAGSDNLADGTIISDNVFKDMEELAIELQKDIAQVVISNNQFINIVGDAIGQSVATANLTNSRIEGNIFDTITGQAIQLDDAVDVTISNNTFKDVTTAIQLDATSSLTNNIHISHNDYITVTNSGWLMRLR